MNKKAPILGAFCLSFIHKKETGNRLSCCYENHLEFPLNTLSTMFPKAAALAFFIS